MNVKLMSAVSRQGEHIAPLIPRSADCDGSTHCRVGRPRKLGFHVSSVCVFEEAEGEVT